MGSKGYKHIQCIIIEGDINKYNNMRGINKYNGNPSRDPRQTKNMGIIG